MDSEGGAEGAQIQLDADAIDDTDALYEVIARGCTLTTRRPSG